MYYFSDVSKCWQDFCKTTTKTTTPSLPSVRFRSQGPHALWSRRRPLRPRTRCRRSRRQLSRSGDCPHHGHWPSLWLPTKTCRHFQALAPYRFSHRMYRVTSARETLASSRGKIQCCCCRAASRHFCPILVLLTSLAEWTIRRAEWIDSLTEVRHVVVSVGDTNLNLSLTCV